MKPENGESLHAEVSEQQLPRIIEAILMVSDEPQSLIHLALALSLPVPRIEAAIVQLLSDYDGNTEAGPRRGFELRESGGGWRFYSRAEYDPWVSLFISTQNPTRLSQAALETLAVIAYKQPIARSSISSIRAVNVDSVVRTLISRGLVCETTQDPETGAMLYGTTQAFLEYLGISSLDELPAMSPLLDDGSEGFDREYR